MKQKRFRPWPTGFVVLLIALSLAGCTSVPRGVHEESRQQIVALRAELAQSQNQLAKLRTQNRDIVARAVEDARRISTLEETNDRLEQSVLAYQDEREEYARSLREIKQKVLASTTTPQAMDQARPFSNSSRSIPVHIASRIP